MSKGNQEEIVQLNSTKLSLINLQHNSVTCGMYLLFYLLMYGTMEQIPFSSKWTYHY